MILKSILFSSIFSIGSILSAQQLYDVTTTQETYTDLTDDTVINLGVWDDIEHVIDIPFNFEVGGQVIDSIYINDSGLNSKIEFGTANPFTQIGVMIPDMVDRAEHDGGASLSPISYKTFSNSGTDYLTVQYKNVGFYDEEIAFGSTSVDFANYQVTLGSDNSISMHYGSINSSFPSEYYENGIETTLGILPKNIIEDTNFTLSLPAHILTGDPASPTLVIESDESAFEAASYGFSSSIASGMKYEFKVYIPIGLDENIVNEVIITNPVKDIINFESKENLDEVIICDNLGRTVLTSVIQSNTIDVTNLNEGIYFIQFKHQGKIVSKNKFMKL